MLQEDRIRDTLLYTWLQRWARTYVLAPRPRHIGKYGVDSYVRLPRSISGTRHIEIGDRVMIHSHSWLSAITRYAGESFTPKIVIGNDVQIGRYVCITSIDRVTIGSDCLFSQYIYISDSAHGMDPMGGLLTEQKLESKGPVEIGAHTFIGCRAAVLSGVKLGEHCVVGANAVVTHSFPDYSMVAGCPARLIKTYSPEKKQWIAVSD